MYLVLAVLLVDSRLDAGDVTTKCQQVTAKSWKELSSQWRGRELIAFASWCSSCKEKILAAKTKPESVVFLSVFEDPSISEAALNRLGISSPCIASDELASTFGIKSLPWNRKL